jgi:Ser/Thr protein kinase RdoA (MazF antagonist)
LHILGAFKRMIHFPVTSSVLSASHLGKFLSDNYTLSANTTCRLLKTFVNDTYVVTSGSDSYIFRVYSVGWRSEKEISEEIRLITILREGNIGVSYAIADASGKYIQTIQAPEGNRFGVLFSFAAGEKRYNPSAETHFRIGEIMAEIHVNTVDVALARVDYSPKTLLIDSFEKFKSYLPLHSDEMEFMRSAQQHALKEFEAVKTAQIRKGAVHLDIWADNLHIEDAMTVTLFDFDFCGNGWLCYDISFYLLMLYGTETNEAEYRKKSESFLKGYESVVRISDEEKRILPVAGAALYFFYLGVQRERFATVFFNEEHLKRYVKFRVKKWLSFNGINP